MTSLLRTVPMTLSFVTLALPALADFTAQEYWDYTVEVAQEQGAEVRANSITRTDSGLIIEGLTLDSKIDGEHFGFAMEGYTLNNRDGGVELLMPEDQEFLIVFEGEDGAPVSLQFTLTHQGFTSLVTGELSEMNAVSSADSLQFALTSATVDGKAIDVTAALDIKQMAMSSDGITIDYSAPFSYEFDAGSLDMSVALSLPEVGVSSASMNRFDDLSANISVTPAEDTDDWTGLMELSASSTQGATQQSSPDTGTLSYSSATGQVAYNGVLQDNFVSLSAAMSDVEIDADVQRLPIGTIGLEAAVVSSEIGFPVAPAPDPQNAALSIDIQGLKVSENIWRMVDPAAAIPREPIALTLEVDGDLAISPKATAPGPDGLMVDIVPSAMRIQTLFAAIGGATLAGTGAFTFDPSDFPLQPGKAPTPEGTLNLSLTGALDLLQHLTNGGVISTEQAMGAQMMMGMMMREGPNGSLETQIKTGADGSISVNGNRIR